MLDEEAEAWRTPSVCGGSGSPLECRVLLVGTGCLGEALSCRRRGKDDHTPGGVRHSRVA